MGHTRWLHGMKPYWAIITGSCLIKTKLTIYQLHVVFSSVQVDSVVFHSAAKYSAWEIHFDFAQSFFNLNFQEILTGICGCLLLNFAENNGYNILLPNIIDTSITHAGYVRLSARRNPWGSFIVQRSTVITALLGNWYSFPYSLRPKSHIRTASPCTIHPLVTDFCVLSHVAI